MANLFLPVTAPAGNGSGSPVDFSAFGANKTIIVSGIWDLIPTVNIEINNDPSSSASSWTTIQTFRGEGTVTIPIACRWIRATVSDFRGGMAPIINIGGSDDGTEFVALVAPAGNGDGADVDTGALEGELHTVHVGGAFRGAVLIEISTDGGVSWAEQMSFSAPGQQTAVFTPDFMRVTRNGVPTVDPGLPIVNIGICDVGGGGGGGGGPTEFADPITPAALPAGDTNNYAPTGFATTSWVRQATNAAGSTITGFAAIDAGHTRLIENLGPGPLTLAAERTSTAANQITPPTGADMIIPPGGTATILYDGTTTRFLPFATSRLTPFLNVRDYGAVGDGVTDDSAAVRRALAAAAALKGTLWCPSGTYILTREGVTAQCIQMPGANVTILGVKGQTWFKNPSGMPATPVRMFYVHQTDDVTFSNVGFDGNWGNATSLVTAASAGAVLPQATINIESTEGFPASGTFVAFPGGVSTTITYTGLTATSFTGCSGGSGTLELNTVVGLANSQTGINQNTQVEPNNHLVMVQDSKGILIDNCLFKQSYGDFIWMGHSSTAPELGFSSVTIRDTECNMSARSGITCGGPCEGVVVDNCQFYNCYGQAFDTESFSNLGAVRDVLIDKSYLDRWWAPFSPRTDNAPLAIGGTQMGAQSSVARHYRVTNTTIMGSVAIAQATDIRIANCRVICDFDGDSAAPFNLLGAIDDIWIIDNYIYDRTGNPVAGVNHYASISCRWYGGLGPILQPANVHITGNTVHSRNGRIGILVEGTGGFSVGNGPVEPAITGVATAITDTTLTHAGAFGAVDSKAGWQVRVGSAIATVATNTANVLTVTLGEPTNNWCDPLGVPVTTPAPGAYVLSSVGGVVDVSNNTVDCTDDGYGAGSFGIHVDSEKSGMRVRVRNNTVRNATDDAIRVTTYNEDKEILFLEISDNTAFDDQATSTTDNAVNFNSVLGNPPQVVQLVMHDNQVAQGVANEVVGLTAGQWRTGENTWDGFGTPEGSIFAPPGSTYSRRDGAGVVYVKETGVEFNTGWTALLTAPRVALRAMGTPASGAGGAGNLTPGSAPSVDGDLEVLVVGAAVTDTPIALITPSGFVAAAPQQVSTYLIQPWTTRCAIFVRRVQGVMADPVVDDNNGFVWARCYSYKDVLEFGDILDVIDVILGSSNDSLALPVSITGDTSTVDGALVCTQVVGFTGGLAATIPDWANADLSELETQDDSAYHIGSDYTYMGLATGNKATAGLYGASTGTFTGPPYAVWAGFTFAIKPATGVVGVERISASGASSPNIERTIITGVATAVTLADGDIDGFIKDVEVRSGTGTFTPANLANGNVLTWTDFAAFSLMWDDVAATWAVISIYGNVVVS